ncbi:MAG: hypothetical protein ABSC18_05275 [Verrucomicrobiota bacterium]|jgi:hypothetical protein
MSEANPINLVQLTEIPAHLSQALPPTPIPWSDFPAECLWYFAPMLVVHAILFVAFCALVGPLPWWQPKEFRRAAIFFGLLLAAGSIFNGLWSCLVYGRLYDRVDYVFGFSPFWPITNSVINETWGTDHGQLLGVTVWQLQLVWLLFASGTWGLTIYLYRSICGRWPLSLKALFPHSSPSSSRT